MPETGNADRRAQWVRQNCKFAADEGMDKSELPSQDGEKQMTDSAKDVDKVLVELQAHPEAIKTRGSFDKDPSSLNTLGSLAQLFDSIQDAGQKKRIERFLNENGLRRNMALQVGVPYRSLPSSLTDNNIANASPHVDLRTAKVSRIHHNSWTTDGFEIIRALYDLE
jgi:hypothetical protein